MRTTISILSLMLFIGFGLAKAQDTGTVPAENTNAPDFKFEKETYDFGTITEGDKINFEYKFTNIGKEPLIITRVKGSCGCTIPQWPKEPIKGGEDGTIKIVFNSKGKVGKQRKTVTVNSNANTPAKRLFLVGTVLKKEVKTESSSTNETETEGGGK
ncbi:MAG: hypothetical protein COC01_02675 [Bacteroidetes bacterium]|nr:MAG: hypothetical protein COC01_02675 [Bacteroidota bacterium]